MNELRSKSRTRLYATLPHLAMPSHPEFGSGSLIPKNPIETSGVMTRNGTERSFSSATPEKSMETVGSMRSCSTRRAYFAGRGAWTTETLAMPSLKSGYPRTRTCQNARMSLKVADSRTREQYIPEFTAISQTTTTSRYHHCVSIKK